MSHHQQHQEEEEQKSYAYLYYVIGLVFGLYTGYIIDKDFIWIPIGGVLGLLTAAFLPMLWPGAVKKADPDLPPFIHNWNQFYAIVISWLVLLIFVFWFITRYFE